MWRQREGTGQAGGPSGCSTSQEDPGCCGTCDEGVVCGASLTSKKVGFSREKDTCTQCQARVDPPLRVVRGEPSAPAATEGEPQGLTEQVGAAPKVSAATAPWTKEDPRKSKALITKDRLPALRAPQLPPGRSRGSERPEWRRDSAFSRGLQR